MSASSAQETQAKIFTRSVRSRERTPDPPHKANDVERDREFLLMGPRYVAEHSTFGVPAVSRPSRPLA